jgi:hypothetical protein
VSSSNSCLEVGVVSVDGRLAFDSPVTFEFPNVNLKLLVSSKNLFVFKHVCFATNLRLIFLKVWSYDILYIVTAVTSHC